MGVPGRRVVPAGGRLSVDLSRDPQGAGGVLAGQSSEGRSDAVLERTLEKVATDTLRPSFMRGNFTSARFAASTSHAAIKPHPATHEARGAVASGGARQATVAAVGRAESGGRLVRAPVAPSGAPVAPSGPVEAGERHASGLGSTAPLSVRPKLVSYTGESPRIGGGACARAQRRRRW
ncbi:hypothetical protein T484DRAFT_1803102 [Baffinella frigidus]|nr:hypothetical protein T484DRAFT_1803102 [Cryptophyta sp. CCMP2293]